MPKNASLINQILRSCEPHLKGRTHGCTDQVCYAKILLANQEPSTHGTKRTLAEGALMFAFGPISEVGRPSLLHRDKATSGKLVSPATTPWLFQ
jgi:hypothetical protein